jgi:hypothetical protein
MGASVSRFGVCARPVSVRSSKTTWNFIRVVKVMVQATTLLTLLALLTVMAIIKSLSNHNSNKNHSIRIAAHEDVDDVDELGLKKRLLTMTTTLPMTNYSNNKSSKLPPVATRTMVAKKAMTIYLPPQQQQHLS